MYIVNIDQMFDTKQRDTFKLGLNYISDMPKCIRPMHDELYALRGE